MSPRKFKPTQQLVSEFELEGGMVWQFTGAPMCRKSDTALSEISENRFYLEQVISNLITAERQQQKMPTPNQPMTACITNPDHTELKLAFWLECLTPNKMN